MDIPYNLFLISKNKPFSWSVKRVFENSKHINSFIPVKDKQILKKYLNKHKDSSLVILDLEGNLDEVEEWLWEVVRVECSSNATFMCLAYENLSQFERKHKIFADKKETYAYIYLQKPFSLYKLIKMLKKAEPLSDTDSGTEREENVKWYSNPIGRIGKIIHDDFIDCKGNQFNLISAHVEKIEKELYYIKDDSIKNILKKYINMFKKKIERKENISYYLRKEFYEKVREFMEV